MGIPSLYDMAYANQQLPNSNLNDTGDPIMFTTHVLRLSLPPVCCMVGFVCLLFHSRAAGSDLLKETAKPFLSQ